MEIVNEIIAQRKKRGNSYGTNVGAEISIEFLRRKKRDFHASFNHPLDSEWRIDSDEYGVSSRTKLCNSIADRRNMNEYARWYNYYYTIPS